MAQGDDDVGGALSALLVELAAAPPAPSEDWAGLRAGERVGHFEIVQELGRGGFGIVYEARDLELGRAVAFKTLRAGTVTGARGERLLQEAEAAARLSHPNIVTLYEVGRFEHGPYLVLELLRGETLAKRLDHGMAHAFGRIKVEGGTRSYMAPEQARGAPEDERTDVFALGVVLHQMLCGHLPFATREALEGESRAPMLEVRDTPGLGAVVGRMLEKDPVKRPRDAGEVMAALEAIREDVARTPASHGGVKTRRAWFAEIVTELKRRRGARVGLLICALGLLAAAPGLGWYFLRSVGRRATTAGEVAAPMVPSIAVLPFLDMSPQHDQEYFADVVAEEILNALAQVEQLRVVGRTSSFVFRGKSDDLRTIGRKLNVAAVLDGSVRREGTRVRITTQLINVADGFHLWSESYDRELTSIFRVQEEIAGAVVGALKVKLLPEQAPTTNQRRTPSVEAYSQYLLGRQYHARQTRDGYRRAVEAYEKAIGLDPTYAPPRAQLAITLRAVGFDAEDGATALKLRKRALAEAERAVALGPDLAEAYASRGLLRMEFLRDWSGAQSDFRRALELSPGDPPSHRRMGLLLASQGHLADAITAVDRATQLDPLDTTSWLCLGILRAARDRK